LTVSEVWIRNKWESVTHDHLFHLVPDRSV
jgi:hypothetical protein